MNVNEAVISRINELCELRKSNVCEISLKGGLSPSTIYELMNGRTKHVKIITLKRFCEGAGITLSEFFQPDYFNEFEE